jgi:hypothetical protein
LREGRRMKKVNIILGFEQRNKSQVMIIKSTMRIFHSYVDNISFTERVVMEEEKHKE